MLCRVDAAVASLVLADAAVVTVAAGVVTLVRKIWPTRRKPAGPLVAVLAGLAALALAITGRPLPGVIAAVLLAGVLAARLKTNAHQAWSRVRACGWSALRPRRKAPPVSHVHIWADGVSSAVMTAFISRQNLASCAIAGIGGLLVPVVRSAKLGREPRGGRIALWAGTRRPAPPWPGMMIGYDAGRTAEKFSNDAASPPPVATTINLSSGANT